MRMEEGTDASSAAGIVSEGGEQPTSMVAPQRSPTSSVGVVGPVVRDTTVHYENPVESTAKRDCRMDDSVGGGSVNVSRAIQGHGGTAYPIFIAANDSMGRDMKSELGDEFSAARFVNGYSKSRRSHIRPGGTTDTTRPKLLIPQLPLFCRGVMEETPVVVLSPLAAPDVDFTRDVLMSAKYPIWQPSVSQLTDASSAARLMPLARVIVINDAEAREATGKKDPVDAIIAMVEGGSQGVIVTSRDGAIARLDDGNWHFAAAHRVQAKRTSRAGDVFTGVLALAIASGYSPQEGMELGQAAAARHVSEQPAMGSLEALAAWASTQPKVDFPGRVPQKPLELPRAIAIAAAASAMVLALLAFA
ncbi:MAG: pfkB family carbohydrate kinase [Planctomycetota bacterium]|jgi:sugar/nucleoside kinase (ribokinase family)